MLVLFCLYPITIGRGKGPSDQKWLIDGNHAFSGGVPGRARWQFESRREEQTTGGSITNERATQLAYKLHPVLTGSGGHCHCHNSSAEHTESKLSFICFVCQYIFYSFNNCHLFLGFLHEGKSRGADAGDARKNRHTVQRIDIAGWVEEEVAWRDGDWLCIIWTFREHSQFAQWYASGQILKGM